MPYVSDAEYAQLQQLRGGGYGRAGGRSAGGGLSMDAPGGVWAPDLRNMPSPGAGFVKNEMTGMWEAPWRGGRDVNSAEYASNFDTSRLTPLTPQQQAERNSFVQYMQRSNPGMAYSPSENAWRPRSADMSEQASVAAQFAGAQREWERTQGLGRGMNDQDWQTMVRGGGFVAPPAQGNQLAVAMPPPPMTATGMVATNPTGIPPAVQRTPAAAVPQPPPPAQPAAPAPAPMTSQVGEPIAAAQQTVRVANGQPPATVASPLTPVAPKPTQQQAFIAPTPVFAGQDDQIRRRAAGTVAPQSTFGQIARGLGAGQPGQFPLPVGPPPVGTTRNVR